MTLVELPNLNGSFIYMPPAASAAPTTSAQALQGLQQFQEGMKNPQDILKETQGKLGVSQAQEQLTGLQGAISNTSRLLSQVAPSVMGRTQNSLVTSAQATRQIGNEQAPIQQNLTDLGREEGQAATQFSTLSGQAEQQANAETQGQQQKLGNLQSIYGNLLGQEQEKARQEQVARDEAYRAQQAAEAKRQYDASLAAQQAAARAGSVPMGPGPGARKSQPSNRDAYNSDLNSLVSQLNAGHAPNYEDSVRALVQHYGGRGISAQEIGEYLYQLYGQHFNMAGTKKFYG